MNRLPHATALLLIDLQKAIDHPSWGRRNNPDAEQNIARLLAAWRACRMPLYHVRHDSTVPHSTYRPGEPGHDFKDEARPLPGETVVPKKTNSAFIGTGLEEKLRAANQFTVVITGVITSNSVEATARMAGNLGFGTYVVSDATFTFGKTDWDGNPRSAEAVHAMSLANLHGEYCTVVTTAEVLAALPLKPLGEVG
jgi:nicotinamidase-related amidase